MPKTAPETTRDRLLGGRVTLDQPTSGLRATTDAVLLAAAVKVGPMERVLDLGCGTGAATLCLAARTPGCRLVGLEAAKDMAVQAKVNAAANGLSDRISIEVGAIPEAKVDGLFDHVMTNPPYLPPGRARPGVDPARSVAMVESVGIGVWLEFGLERLKPRGVLTLVHRADRLDDILTALSGVAGEVAILPIWPDVAGVKPARRVLVRARKGVRSPMCLLPGLALHEADGSYTQAAQSVLRDGHAISWA